MKSISFALLLTAASTLNALADDVLIQGITLDKPQVCPGETAQVTVSPLPTVSDPYVMINGQEGNPGVVSFLEPGPYEIPVLVRDGIAYQSTTTTIEVLDCPAGPHLDLAYTWPNLKESTLAFEVQPTGLGTASVKYRWDFGDGTIATSNKTSVQHSYSLRGQTLPVSTATYVVSVSAINRADHSVMAATRQSVVLTNKEKQAPLDTYRTLPVQYDRFAKVTRKRHVVFVTVKNPTNDYLLLDDVNVTATRCDGSTATATDNAAAFFGAPIRIESGASWRGSFSLKKSLFADASNVALCRAVVSLVATGPSGSLHANLPLELVHHLAKGTIVTDRTLAERLRSARAFYKKDDITVEELDALQSEVAPNLPPVADAGGGYSLDAPGEITFDASKSFDPDGTIVSYDWAFGDGASKTGVVVKHTYGAVGFYADALNVTDNAGAQTSVAVPVSVGRNADTNRPPAVQIVTNRTSCYPASPATCQVWVTADARDPDGDPLAIAWSGCASGSTGTTTCTVPAPGTYTAAVTVTDSFGATASASLDITGTSSDDATLVRDAQVEIVDAPTIMAVSGSYPVKVKVKNTGTRPWDALGSGCNTFYLGSASPADNMTWGLNRIPLPAIVDPGRELTLAFTVTAPSTIGVYGFQWKMRQDCLSGFGAQNPAVSVPVTATGIPMGKALLLTAGPPTADELAMQTRLTALGYTVTTLYGCSATAADANGAALLMIGPGVSPACFDVGFQNVAVPVVVSKAAILPKMGMTGGAANSNWGSVTNQTQLAIAAPSKAMAAGLTGTVTVESATASYFAWGNPNANAISVASVVGAPAWNTIFAYEKFAQMPGGPAPARRIGTFWGDGAAANFNINGWKLFDAAVKAATSPVGSAW